MIDMKEKKPMKRVINEKRIEKREAENFLLTIKSTELHVEDLLKTEDDYIEETICHLKQELKVIEHYINNEADSLTMIGFGYFPSTLLMLRKRFPLLELLGIDADREVCVFVKALLEKFESTKSIQLLHSDADKISYHNTDYIFLANALLNKSDILDAIHRTAKKDVVIFTRTPLSSDSDIFEPLQLKQRFLIQESLAGETSNLWVLTCAV